MGRATAHLFADEGANVAVVDLNESGVSTVVDEITGAGASAQGWAIDVTDSEALGRLVAEVVDRFGALDIVINNAGVAIPGGAAVPDQQFEAGWARTIDVNLTAQARLI